MKREITRRHSLLFEKKGARNLLGLFDDLYRYQKWSELISFAVWEAFHKLGLFPKDQYLKFVNREALSVEKVGLNAEFDETIFWFFKSRGLTVARSPINWKLLFTGNKGEIFGCVYPDDKALYRSVDGGKSISFIYKFPEPIKSIFVSSQNAIFVCLKGSVYQSDDHGAFFKKILELGSPESFFRHNNAMTQTPDGTLLFGEYGNFWEKGGWRKLAYLYFSFDGGETWGRSNFLLEKGTNKHIHLVKYSQMLDRILVADGDNKKKLWISGPVSSSTFLSPDQWKAVNKFHIQMGGYTSVVENDGKILFGTDYQGGTNFIVETRDGEKFTKRIVPDPYRRSPIDNMVPRMAKNGVEIWANLPYSAANTRCLLMYSTDGGESWEKVIEYNRAAHKVWLLSASNEISDTLYFSIENTISKKRVVYKVTEAL